MNLVKITKTSLLADVDANLTRKEMSEKYGISVQRVAKVLAQAGMKGIRVKNPGYEFIDDTVDNASTRVSTIIKDDFEPNYAGMAQM